VAGTYDTRQETAFRGTQKGSYDHQTRIATVRGEKKRKFDQLALAGPRGVDLLSPLDETHTHCDYSPKNGEDAEPDPRRDLFDGEIRRDFGRLRE
jgi:hypothetical protein